MLAGEELDSEGELLRRAAPISGQQQQSAGRGAHSMVIKSNHLDAVRVI
jgi:hypothetical protein